MHELSIAHSLVEVVTEAAEKAGAKKVTRVQLRLGALSGVARDALEFGFELATRGTLLDGAALEVEELPVILACDRCGADSVLEGIQGFACPACGALSPRLRQGRELDINGIEIDTD